MKEERWLVEMCIFENTWRLLYISTYVITSCPSSRYSRLPAVASVKHSVHWIRLNHHLFNNSRVFNFKSHNIEKLATSLLYMEYNGSIWFSSVNVKLGDKSVSLYSRLVSVLDLLCVVLLLRCVRDCEMCNFWYNIASHLEVVYIFEYYIFERVSCNLQILKWIWVWKCDILTCLHLNAFLWCLTKSSMYLWHIICD